MLMVVRIALVITEDPGRPVTGARVGLFDRDEHDPDDFLAEGVTDAAGKVSLSFDSDQYIDQEDHPLWRNDSLPDLYVVVYAPDGRVVLNTRALTQVDTMPTEIVVGVDQAKAQRFSLI